MRFSSVLKLIFEFIGVHIVMLFSKPASAFLVIIIPPQNMDYERKN